MPLNDGEVCKVVKTILMPSLVLGQNVYYWRLDDPVPDNPSDAQIISALDTKLTDMCNQVDQLMSNEYSFGSFSAERVTWDGSKWETTSNLGEAVLNILGTLVADAMPHGVAAVVAAQTTRPQTRARKFLAGLTDTNAEDSTWSGAVMTALALYALAWIGSQAVVGSAELVPVVLGQSGPSAGIIYPLISAAASSIAGYQRRRKPGVGS